MTETDPSAEEKIRWRLPRMGCFLIFFLFFMLGGAISVTLARSLWDIPPKWELPEENVSVSDPAQLLLPEDREEIGRLAAQAAEKAHCRVALMFVNERNAGWRNVCDAIVSELGEEKGVVMLFSLRQNAFRVVLTGSGWVLKNWDVRALQNELRNCSGRQRGAAAKSVLNRLLRSLDVTPEERSTAAAAVPVERGGVIFSRTQYEDPDTPPYVFALVFAAFSFGLGLLALRNGKKTRAANLAHNPSVLKEFEKRSPGDPKLKLIDRNAYDPARWGHNRVLKIIAIVLGLLMGLGVGVPTEEDGGIVQKDRKGSVPSAAIPQTVSGRVVDEAEVFSHEERAMLSRRIDEMERRTGGEIMVFTVPTTGTVPIEEFSLNAASTWKIGKAGKDNGALLVLAIDDRKNRLEIGYGWEGPVNDARAGDILRSIVPELRAGRYADAAVKVVAGVEKFVLADGDGSSAAGQGGRGTGIYNFAPRSAPEKDPRAYDAAAALWAVFGILASLIGICIGYWGRIVMTSGHAWMIYDPSIRLLGGSGGGGGSSGWYSGGGSSSRSGYSSSRSSSGGGGSFGGGGASGSW